MIGETRAADASGISWTAPRIALMACASLAIFYTVLAIRFTLVPTGDGVHNASGGVLGNDFLFFYSASKLVLAGTPQMVFDQARFFDLQESIAGQRLQFPWAYPPHLLLLIAPLALLSYIPALFAWLAVTTAPLILLIRKLSGAPLLAALILPPLIQNTISGQNGALTASLAAGAIAALAARRNFLGGLLFGCLVYKPQVFVLAPICLLACRSPRAFAGLAVSGLGLPLAGLLLFGPDMWRMFFEHLPDQMSYVVSGRMPRKRFATIFIFLLDTTASETIARIGQGISTLAAWAMVYACWRRSGDVFVRAFAFCVALPLSTPYLYEYDFALWSLPAAFLAMRIWRGQGGAGDWAAFLILSFLPPGIWISSLVGLNFAVIGILALVPLLAREVLGRGWIDEDDKLIS